jgi:hypothetical protein
MDVRIDVIQAGSEFRKRGRGPRGFALLGPGARTRTPSYDMQGCGRGDARPGHACRPSRPP